MSLRSAYLMKDEVQDGAISRFVEHLNAVRISDFKVVERDVPSRPGSQKNYDARLVNTRGHRIALEHFLLPLSQREEDDKRFFDSLGHLLAVDLGRRGIPKAWLLFGDRRPVRGPIRAGAVALAGEIEAALRANPNDVADLFSRHAAPSRAPAAARGSPEYVSFPPVSRNTPTAGRSSRNVRIAG